MSFKLFVTDETSPDPDKWDEWNEISVVVARSLEEALEMTGDSFGCEIPMDRPMYLFKRPTAGLHMGDDL